MTKELKERFDEIADKFYNSNSQYDLMKCLEAAYALDRREWVPVKERSPESGLKVLCYTEQEWYQVGAMFPEHQYFSGDNSYNAITHWMNLPNPPTK